MVSTAQNTNCLLSFLVIFKIIECISSLVSCFPAVGGVMLCDWVMDNRLCDMGHVICIFL